MKLIVNCISKKFSSDTILNVCLIKVIWGCQLPKRGSGGCSPGGSVAFVGTTLVYKGEGQPTLTLSRGVRGHFWLSEGVNSLTPIDGQGVGC